MNRSSCLLFICLILTTGTVTAENVELHADFTDAIAWSYQGKPTPKTYWSPWTPSPTVALRYKLGIRFSTGTIALKDSVRVTFQYDTSQAKEGKVLSLMVRAKPTDQTHNTFESAFGVQLPNQIQAGFFGCEGIPDILPWFDLPLDFWDLVSMVPKAGSLIASAEDNIGVNMLSKEGLPLGESKEYHDTRTLISVSVGDFVKADKQTAAANKIFSKLSDSKKTKIINAIKLFKKTDNAGAEAIAKNTIKKGIGKLVNLASISVIGDPSYKVEGETIIVDIRYYIPGKVSGSMPLIFTEADQAHEVKIPIPAFIDDQDKINITVDKVSYRFRLTQKLDFRIGISIAPDFSLIDDTKLVDLVTVGKEYNEGYFRHLIPVQPSDEAVMDFHVIPGCISATARWASPHIPLKGTVKLFKNGSKIAEKAEAGFSTVHNLSFDGLQENTKYTLSLACVDTAGNTYAEGTSSSVTTKTGCTTPTSFTSVYSSLRKRDYKLTNPVASPGKDNIVFSWKTTYPMSTEVYFGTSPDIGENYTAAVKKSDGQVAVVYFSTAPGERKLETNHSIGVTALQPATTYYYRMISWSFEDDNPTKTNETELRYVGTVTTEAVPPPPTVRIKVLADNQPVKDLPVALTGTARPFSCVVSTNEDGYTPQITLEPHDTYKAEIQPVGCFNGAVRAIPVSANASGPLSDVVIKLGHLSSPGGIILDDKGDGVNKALVKLLPKNSSTYTQSTGQYQFSSLSPGSYTIQISKSGFKTKSITTTVDQCGLFAPPVCVLEPSALTINLEVRDTRDNILVGVPVQIKEGTTTLATLTTNIQGKAIFTVAYDDYSNHNLKITATPPQNNVFQTQEDLTVHGGQAHDIELLCDCDYNPPVISNLEMHASGHQIFVQADFDESSQVGYERTGPEGNTTTHWYSGLKIKTGNLILCSMSTIGQYQVKMLVRDAYGNQTETPVLEVDYQGQPLSVSVSDITQASAKLSWNKSGDTACKGYAIQLNNNQIATVNGRSSTQHNLTGLAKTTSYTAIVTALNIDEQPIASGQVEFATISQLPQIAEFSITPEVIGLYAGPDHSEDWGHIKIRANDPDSKIRLVMLSYKRGSSTSTHKVIEKVFDSQAIDFTTDYHSIVDGSQTLILKVFDESSEVTAEKEIKVLPFQMPHIGFRNPPSQVFENNPASFTVNVYNRSKLDGASLSCKVDWGDGKTEQQKLKESDFDGNTFTVSHKYLKEGNYNVSLFLQATKGSDKLTSQTINSSILVKKTVVEEKEIQGQLPDTPDGQLKPVRPDSIPDTRPDTGADGGVSQTLQIKIINVPDQVVVGQRAKISVTILNTSSESINDAVLQISEDDGFKENKKLVLAAGRERSAYVYWTPNTPGSHTLMVSIDSPSAGQVRENRTVNVQGIDLAIKEVDVPQTLQLDKRQRLDITIANNSSETARNVSLLFKVNNKTEDTKKITASASRDTKSNFYWTPQSTGAYILNFSIDYEGDTININNSRTIHVNVQ